LRQSLDQVELAIAIVWFYQRVAPSYAATATELAKGLFDLGLTDSKVTARSLYPQLKTHRALTQKGAHFRVKPRFMAELDEKYLPLLQEKKPTGATSRVNVETTPLLTADDVQAARRMAELYLILHCYENSARELVDKTLSAKFGPDWWSLKVSDKLKGKVQTRISNEKANKWISPRGQKPLMYVDWGDLHRLIRNFEEQFQECIPGYRFVEGRFEELERFRNIIAHNGVLSSDDVDHIVVSFRQWCRQLGTSEGAKGDRT